MPAFPLEIKILIFSSMLYEIIEIKFIQPGKPTQNGIVERLNGTVRTECLNLNWFYSLEEINHLLGQWYKTYNFDRPHSSLNYQTPSNFENLNQNLYFRMVPVNEGLDTTSKPWQIQRETQVATKLCVEVV